MEVRSRTSREGDDPRRRRRLVRVTAWLSAALLVAAACTGDETTDDGTEEAGELVISSFGGTWGQAIQLGFIDGFERETGIDVKLLDTQDVPASIAAIESGNPPTEDIIDASLGATIAWADDGLLAPIDYSDWDQGVLDAVPETAPGKYTVAWGYFAIGLCFDADVFPDGGPQPASWADYWDFEKFPGKRGMFTWTAGGVGEFGLLAEGVPVDEVYPLDIDRAFEKLEELDPYVPSYPDSPAVLQQQLIDKQVVMETCYTHRVQNLIDGGLENIRIIFDQARLESDIFAVWEEAPNKENAMKFLEYVLKAEPQATWAQIGNTGPINPDAFELIPESAAERLPTNPDFSTFEKNEEWYTEVNGGVTNYDRVVELFNEFAPAPAE